MNNDNDELKMTDLRFGDDCPVCGHMLYESKTGTDEDGDPIIVVNCKDCGYEAQCD